MAFIRRVSHLWLINVLLFGVALHDTETSPLCGRSNESSSQKDTDQIYFPGPHGRYHSKQVNGTVITCDSDGKIIKTTSVNNTQSTDTHEDQLNEGNFFFSLLKHRVHEYSSRENMIMKYAITISHMEFVTNQISLNLTDTNRKSSEIKIDIKLQSFSANVSECADNEDTYCIKKFNYPADYIQKLLQKFSHEFVDVFGSDLTMNEVAFRIDALDDEYLCDSYEDVIYPTAGKTQDGKELFILNTETHRQGVRVSKCQKKGQPCKMSESFPVIYQTECKQQMVYRELLSLSPEGKPVKDHFEFPACCSCVLHRIH